MSTEIEFRILSVTPTLIEVEFTRPKTYNQEFNIGNYVKIPDKKDDANFIVGIIESYTIKTEPEKNTVVKQGEKNTNDKPLDPKFILNIQPVGTLIKNKSKTSFQRGFRNIPIPPIDDVKLVSKKELEEIYNCNLKNEEKFSFSKIEYSLNEEIKVPVNGNRFFNKHIAVVGATGSGKSHTITKILQNAVTSKNGVFNLNNSHIIIFDIHAEYKTAFPDANFIGVKELILPYWLLTSEELVDLFIDTEANDHNQRNVFKEAVINSRKKHFKGSDIEKDKIHFDSSLFFDINDVLQHAINKNEEMEQGMKGLKQGSLYGKLTNFVSRLENKLNDKRFEFFLGDSCKKITFEETLRQFTSYGFRKNKLANVTILDLSGIPFEVLSVTVSLISRIMFELGYFYKKINANVDIPILLVYEEAHKYVPQSDMAKYRASKESIERIAKEGRKYGVSILVASQRPSEVSKTIFAQCNNFIAMRLTNPEDQSYVKQLLPDTLGGLTNNLPVLRTGEAIIIGDAIEIPSIVQIDRCEPEPSSSDIPYLEKWREKWFDVDFEKIVKDWDK